MRSGRPAQVLLGLASVGSAEAAFQAWLQGRQHVERDRWLKPGADVLVRELLTKTVLDLARLTERGANAPRLRLLDVGCDAARFVQDALPYAAAIGVDRSPELLGSAARRSRRGRFLAGGAAALPFTSERFDVVTLLDTLARTADRDEPLTLREARRVLKPGGRIVIARTRGIGSERHRVRRFSALFDDFSDVEIVGLVPDAPLLRMWMATPIAWRLARSRVRTCAPAQAQVLVGAGLKR